MELKLYDDVKQMIIDAITDEPKPLYELQKITGFSVNILGFIMADLKKEKKAKMITSSGVRLWRLK